MSELGEEIGSIRHDLNLLKNESSETGDVAALGDQFSGDVTPETRAVVLNKRGYDFNNTFILGHNSAGVLGTSKLGASITYEDYERVINYNNTFEEYFDIDTFIDTINSTGTLDTSNANYTIDGSETLYSTIIAKNNTNYSRATFTVTGTNTDSADLYLSGDGGSNWESTSNSTEHTFSVSNTDGIKYKIENNTGGSFPTEWGTWGSESSTIVIDTIKITYS